MTIWVEKPKEVFVAKWDGHGFSGVNWIEKRLCEPGSKITKGKVKRVRESNLLLVCTEKGVFKALPGEFIVFDAETGLKIYKEEHLKGKFQPKGSLEK